MSNLRIFLSMPDEPVLDWDTQSYSPKKVRAVDGELAGTTIVAIDNEGIHI
jgi:hypothetical protein